MEAEAPIRINTRENPHTKKMVDTITLFRKEATMSSVVGSLAPAMYSMREAFT